MSDFSSYQAERDCEILTGQFEGLVQTTMKQRSAIDILELSIPQEDSRLHMAQLNLNQTERRLHEIERELGSIKEKSGGKFEILKIRFEGLQGVVDVQRSEHSSLKELLERHRRELALTKWSLKRNENRLQDIANKLGVSI